MAHKYYNIVKMVKKILNWLTTYNLDELLQKLRNLMSKIEYNLTDTYNNQKLHSVSGIQLSFYSLK